VTQKYRFDIDTIVSCVSFIFKLYKIET